MKQAFRANFLERADALSRWLIKRRKNLGDQDTLTGKMKELDYWQEETKNEKIGDKNLFTSPGEGRNRSESIGGGGPDMKKMARTIGTRFQEVIDLVRSNQEANDLRLQALEKMLQENHDQNSWNRSMQLMMGFALTVGGLSYLIVSKFS